MNDAERLCRDPAMGWVVGGRMSCCLCRHLRTGRAVDPEREPNAIYVSRHTSSYDVQSMSTHRGPGQCYLREMAAAEAPFDVDQFLGSYGDCEIDTCAADYVLSGLVGANEEAVRAIAAFIAGLPAELAELRGQAEAADKKPPAAAAGARKSPRVARANRVPPIMRDGAGGGP